MSTKKQKVTLTNAQINGSNAWLSHLANGVTDYILGYRIAQNLKPIAELAEQYQQATRTIIKDNGAKIENDQYVRDKDGKIVFEQPEGKAAADVALNEIADLENEVEYYPIKLSRVANGAKLGDGVIVPMLVSLEWMIVFDLEDEDESGDVE
jgi:hypothetical protein